MTAVCVSLNNLGDLPLVLAALERRGAGAPLPFVEILWDNFCHLDPAWLRDFLAPLSAEVSFHVMMSKFLERTGDELQTFLRHLASHVRVVKPARVSDHLARFRVGRINTSLPLEMRYDRGEASRAAERVARYQDWIGQELLLENYASTEPQGERQIEFVDRLRRRTGCGLLFDVSSAVVAERSGILPLAAWLDYLAGAGAAPALHGHVGGYRLSRSGDRYHGTHDSPITPATAAALGRVAKATRLATLCYERDESKSVPALVGDLEIIDVAIGLGRATRPAPWRIAAAAAPARPRATATATTTAARLSPRLSLVQP